MSNAKSRKLQYLLISQLLEQGSVQLILPDGVTLDIGIVQEDQFGNKKKSDDYCYVVASREGRTAMIDSFNLSLQYEAEQDAIVCEYEEQDVNGRLIKSLDVV